MRRVFRRALAIFRFLVTLEARAGGHLCLSSRIERETDAFSWQQRSRDEEDARAAYEFLMTASLPSWPFRGGREEGRRLIVADGALSRAVETLGGQRRGPIALRASKRCTACNTQSACHEDNNGERHESSSTRVGDSA